MYVSMHVRVYVYMYVFIYVCIYVCTVHMYVKLVLVVIQETSIGLLSHQVSILLLLLSSLLLLLLPDALQITLSAEMFCF